MTLVVQVATEAGRLPLARERVADIARAVLRSEGVRDALLSIAFVSPRDIARINQRHLGHRGSTDVISFQLTRGRSEPVIGDIYIAPAVARDNARSHRVGVREELARLVVHGTLHVVGHDHPEGTGRTASPMWKRQEALVRRALRKRT
ncbi:MAG TPA: rRNA maturation RNase YbeY [Gemmatimonadaceae bacterium]|nr:rRNA maturation RNase YbeY [Gemmatimonadaceae bacterium]